MAATHPSRGVLMDPRDPSAALSRAHFQRMVNAPPKRFYARLLRTEGEVRLRVQTPTGLSHVTGPAAWWTRTCRCSTAAIRLNVREPGRPSPADHTVTAATASPTPS